MVKEKSESSRIFDEDGYRKVCKVKSFEEVFESKVFRLLFDKSKNFPQQI